jgi:uncharacterized protein (DUF1697 family)
MKTHIALLRGINVGGHGRLPMKDLREILENLGLTNVKTYLQSGNAVFQSNSGHTDELSRDIGSAITESHGFTPEVLVLSLEELQSAIASDPFPAAAKDPKTLHLFFLKSRPENPGLAKLDSLRTANEKFELLDLVFYLHTPDGIGQSKLGSNVEKALGVAVTARNWRSVNAVMSLALEVAG